MPGMPQGRDINEAGPKSVTLVTVADDRTVTVEERVTSIAQFERVAVDLDGIDEWNEVVSTIETALGRARDAAASEHLVARLTLTGSTPLAWKLRRDGDLIKTEADTRAETIGRSWVEKLEIDCVAPEAAASPGRSAIPSRNSATSSAARFCTRRRSGPRWRPSPRNCAGNCRRNAGPRSSATMPRASRPRWRATWRTAPRTSWPGSMRRPRTNRPEMRLRRLDLTRYGKFTDRRIDFGPAEPGRPDLHIVYGPNEAGKSTAFAGFLDLLFGIETRSRYNFVHPYAAMQIGGALDLSGGCQELVRVKRPQASLFDDAKRPVAEALIGGELGGIDRAGYRTMFSLDDETLEAGGNNILASKGDLGQLLFSASAGLADLSQTLVGLRLEADGFYKLRARSGVLSELKARLATLKARREESDTFAAAYAELVGARDRTRAQYDAALADRARVRARLDEIGRHTAALPRLSALRGLREQSRPLDDLPDVPAAWVSELPDIERREIEGGVALEGIDAGIEALSTALKAIAVDDVARRLSPRVARLVEARARHLTADKDLPERRLAARAASLAIVSLLGRLGVPPDTDPRDVTLAAPTLGALRALLESRSGVASAVANAEGERDAAEQGLCEARDRLKEAGGSESGADTSRLADVVAALRGGDHAARRVAAERALPRLREMLAGSLEALRPWPGDVGQLQALVLPDLAAFERLSKLGDEAQDRIDRETADIERLSGERRRLMAEVDALGAIAGVVGEREAAAIRAARERAWAEHRRALEATSADRFEDLLRHDDMVTSARFGRAADVAKLQQVSLALATVEVDLERARERHATAEHQLQGVAQRIEAALVPVVPPLPADIDAPRLGAWMARRREALVADAALREAERDLSHAEADARAAHDSIAEALREARVAHDPEARFARLMADAQASLDRGAELKALRTTVEERQRALVDRHRRLAEARRAEAGWSAAWAAACAECWLGRDGAIPSVDAVREVLKILVELTPVLQTQGDLAYRIAAMEKDQDAFAADVSGLAAALSLPTDGVGIMDLDDEICRRVRQAGQDEETRLKGERELEAARQRRATVAAAGAVNFVRKSEMTRFFGVETLTEVGQRFRAVERRDDVRRQAEAAVQELRSALRVDDVEAAEVLLAGLDPSGLDAEAIELQARFDDLDGRTRALFAEHARAFDAVEAVGGDDAVARIEEQRRTTLLEIEDQARHYLRLRAGIASAEQALRSYRDRHRSAMMERASKAFAVISREAYRGLVTQPDKDVEILMGVAADGSTKVASDLSKGTRFQLYLALRIAGYFEFAAARRVVPFIADDIMETFDDFRAEEAFRLFAGMAEVGQVIYLTHHRHLCDIARDACPSVRIHDLSPPALSLAS